MLDRRGDPGRPFYLGRAAASTPCLRKTSVLQLEHKKIDRAVRFLLSPHTRADSICDQVPPPDPDRSEAKCRVAFDLALIPALCDGMCSK